MSNPLRFNWHERLEFLVPVAGRGSFRMGERVFDFAPGDIIVVDNLKLHGPLSYRGPERLLAVITFMPDLVSNPLSYPVRCELSVRILLAAVRTRSQGAHDGQGVGRYPFGDRQHAAQLSG